MSAQLRAAWEEYREAMVPKGASQTQIQETKTAFYAGMVKMHFLYSNCTAKCTPLEAIARLDGLTVELLEFCKTVLQGKVGS